MEERERDGRGNGVGVGIGGGRVVAQRGLLRQVGGEERVREGVGGAHQRRCILETKGNTYQGMPSNRSVHKSTQSSLLNNLQFTK